MENKTPAATDRCKYRQKKVSSLKRKPTKSERQPQKLNRNQRNRTTDIRKVNANRTTSVGNQPPASQPTTKNTFKHNAYVHRLDGTDARADQKILFLFCLFDFWQKKKEDFLRLAKRTLVSFGNHTCNFAIMFWCIC